MRRAEPSSQARDLAKLQGTEDRAEEVIDLHRTTAGGRDNSLVPAAKPQGAINSRDVRLLRLRRRGKQVVPATCEYAFINALADALRHDPAAPKES